MYFLHDEAVVEWVTLDHGTNYSLCKIKIGMKIDTAKQKMKQFMNAKNWGYRKQGSGKGWINYRVTGDFDTGYGEVVLNISYKNNKVTYVGFGWEGA